MKSAELVKLLSMQGSKDLASSSQWISPIPDESTALVEKITTALQIVKFSQSRCAEGPGGKSSTQHLDALIRLQSEIEHILQNN